MQAYIPEQKTATLEEALRYLRPVCAYAGVVGFFIHLLILPLSLYSLQVLDRVMSTGSIPTLLWLTLLMIVFFVIAGLLQSLRGIMLLRAGEWLQETLSQAILPRALSHATGNQGKGAQGMRDAGALRNFLGGAGLTTLMDAPWSVLYITVLFIIHPALGVLTTMGAGLLLALAWLTEYATGKPLQEAGGLQIRGLQELELATRNAEVITAMGMGGTLAGRILEANRLASAQQMLAGSRSAAIQGITKFVRLTLQVLVTCVSAWLALTGSITVGAIIAASILASRALAPFETAIAGWKAYTDARSALARLRELLGAPPRTEGMALPPPSGRLAADSVTYALPGHSQPVLRQLNFQLEPGEMLGVIGPSGAGKSTLARLLTGMFSPVAGVVRLDGGNVFTWPREEFGRYVGYLPQDVELFGGTVRDNIARLRADATPEAVVDAALLANAHEMILHLPQGYDTPIGPGGAALSAGQRQRIGLARAFYGMPRLLVLDEPDASLDDTGQLALIQALKQARMKRITAVVITHRRAILAGVDKLLLLKDGSYTFGPPQQVMEALSPAPKAMGGKPA